jgi:hypothetical protein
MKELLEEMAFLLEGGNFAYPTALLTKIKAALAQQEPWCMKMNGCKTKCEDCPDEPAQEPVAWLDEEKKIIYWHNTHETDDYHGFKRSTPLYTTPQQRPWVGLTEAQFLEAVRLAENGNYLVAFKRIQEWLKEGNT